VPKTDSQVKILLTTREDIFVNYDFEGFEEAFSKYYKIRTQEDLAESDRRVYLMERK
jgi:hypothetical protein